MITEDYVSFEVAKLLKEKGFDEPLNRIIYYNGTKELLERKITNSQCNSDFCSCLTHQMAMKWLREIHNIDLMVEPYESEADWKDKLYHIIVFKDLKQEYAIYGNRFYEEAVKAALKYCLTNLI